MLEFAIIIAAVVGAWLFVQSKNSNDESSSIATTSAESTEPTQSAPSRFQSTHSASTEPGGVPEDSSLKRHYLQNLSAQKAAKPVTKKIETPAPVKAPKPAKKTTQKATAAVSHASPTLPEDASLKRHFIQKLSAEIAETLPPRPTDSGLQRHYDAQLESAVLDQLNALK